MQKSQRRPLNKKQSEEASRPLLYKSNNFIWSLINMFQLMPKRKAPTKQIGNYVFSMGDVIGKGFSSIVYKAKSKEQFFAIKVIQEKSLTAFRRRLLEGEIRCFSLTTHPNILRCFDVYSTRNNHYLVTQLCQGGTLYQLIKKRPLREEQVLGYLRQLVEGEIELRRLGLLHRDIKTSNLLISGEVLKIADFGFACKEQDLRKQTKQNVGTPVYMAPEAILENRYSQKSQVFAVGVVGYELLTGKLPWSAASEKELANKMKKLQPSFRGSQASQSTIAILEDCLRAQPESRPTICQLRERLSKDSKTSSLETASGQ